MEEWQLSMAIIAYDRGNFTMRWTLLNSLLQQRSRITLLKMAAVSIVAIVIPLVTLLTSTLVMWLEEHLWNFTVPILFNP
jgi:hypothetical protein